MYKNFLSLYMLSFYFLVGIACSTKVFYFFSIVFVDLSTQIIPLFLSHSFVIQITVQWQNFHGTQPKEIFYIVKSLCTLKDTSLPHLKNLPWNHNFCSSLHMLAFLLQPQQTYRKLHPRNTVNAPTIWSFVKELKAMVVILSISVLPD